MYIYVWTFHTFLELKIQFLVHWNFFFCLKSLLNLDDDSSSFYVFYFLVFSSESNPQGLNQTKV